MPAPHIESFEDIALQFPGITELEPRAIGRFVFFSAGHFPDELYRSELELEGRWWERPRREDWEKEVSRLLSNVHGWREDEQPDPKRTRYDLAKNAEQEMVLAKETTELIQTFSEEALDITFDAAVEYLDRWGFNAGIMLDPSALFPEGRSMVKPASSYVDRNTRKCSFPHDASIYRDGFGNKKYEQLDQRIADYLSYQYNAQKLNAQIKSALESFQGVSPEYVQQLREEYGAKAANLMVFQDALHKISTAANADGTLLNIEIPPFHAIPVAMFEAWTHNSSAYQILLEEAREQALKLASQTIGGLVAVRSSAVYSEDGEEHTGAGIYKSTAIDPSDPQAFAKAVESVFASTTSPDALMYQENCGVTQERMGILLQAYVEQQQSVFPRAAFGFINSRGANPNLIEAHTPFGTLLFDKLKLQSSLLTEVHNVSDLLSSLHSLPDHTQDLRYMPAQVYDTVHAALFAEMLFKAPIQLEYAAEGKVVQVRPLPRSTFQNNEGIVFPEGVSEITRTKSIGMGDATLEELDEHHDNSNKEGFVTFESEYGFTDDYNRLHGGLRSLPRKGAVIILHHSDSGHIQTLCQEKGLMCFYPDSESNTIEGLIDYLEDSSSNRDSLEPNNTARKLRFVTDGYEGRIYEAQ